MSASVQVAQASGDVTAQSALVPHRQLKAGDVLGSGYTVTTGQNSHVVLRFDDGQIVALKSLSSLQIDSYKYESGNPAAGEVIMSLLTGGLRTITGLVANTNRSAFALRTPSATIGIRGTDFLAALYQGTYTLVNSGAISMTNPKGATDFAVEETGFAAGPNAAPSKIPASAVPEGLFTELQGISLSSALRGGSSAGAGTGVSATAIGIGAAVAIGIGVAVAAGGDDDGGGTTTTHH
jgi:hypothetical protein